jgi:RNA polymerase sigma factor (sigma-70 family)
MKKPRLSADQEKDLARRALQHVDEATRLIGFVDVKPHRNERTGGMRLDRLERACRKASKAGEPERRRTGRKAVAEFERAKALWWELAVSAVHIAEHEAHHCKGPLGLEDNGQEGLIGLYDAAKRFDPNRGIRFTTYARWWARARITRAIAQGGRAIAFSSHAEGILINARKAPNATPGEQADAIGVSRTVYAAIQRAMNVASLDNPLGTDGDGTHLELVPDDNAVDADEELHWRTLAERVGPALRALPARERLIVERHLRGETLTSVGHRIRLSRERVRQLEALAFGRLRAAAGVVEPSDPIGDLTLTELQMRYGLDYQQVERLRDLARMSA